MGVVAITEACALVLVVVIGIRALVIAGSCGVTVVVVSRIGSYGGELVRCVREASSWEKEVERVWSWLEEASWESVEFV